MIFHNCQDNLARYAADAKATLSFEQHQRFRIALHQTGKVNAYVGVLAGHLCRIGEPWATTVRYNKGNIRKRHCCFINSQRMRIFQKTAGPGSIACVNCYGHIIGTRQFKQRPMPFIVDIDSIITGIELNAQTMRILNKAFKFLCRFSAFASVIASLFTPMQ